MTIILFLTVPRRCRHSVAAQVHNARVSSAIMRGLAPESVPAIEMQKVGGVMVPVGTGLRPSRSGIRISEPWGTAHPGYGIAKGHRVQFSIDELRVLSDKLESTLLEFPDAKDTKLASRVLKKIQNDPSVRKIMHERHIITVDRLKTGIMRLRKLKASGELDLLFEALDFSLAAGCSLNHCSNRSCCRACCFRHRYHCRNHRSRRT